MALVVADRVQETTTTTGTGTYTLAGAKDGFQSFAAVGNSNTTYYACTDGTDYEIGIGTYTLSGTTLARTTIIESSNSDAAVNWGAGEKDIFVTLPASKATVLDASNNLTLSGKISAGELDIDNIGINGGTITGQTGSMSLSGNVTVENGTLTAQGTTTLQDDVTFTGASYNAVWDKSDSALEFADNAKAAFGTGSDMLMYHNGSNSYIVNYTGVLNITNYANDQDVIIKSDNGIGGSTNYFLADGSTGEVQLYAYGSPKLKTQSSGIDVTGNIAVSGTVDGRDVATDGTKLDGIEASADVTDATNVQAAGALMDSEVTNLAQVKAFDSSDYATAAQGTTADNALPKAGGSMTGALSISQGTAGTASLSVTNSGGYGNNALIASFVGDSDAIEIRNHAQGDYKIVNNEQDNGISIYDGIGGVKLRYNGTDVAGCDSSGGFEVSGTITASDDIIINSSGLTGSACLRINNSSTTNNFPKSIEAYNSGIGVGHRHQIMLGKDGSTYDTASISYYYAGNASTSNRLEFGFWGAGSLLNVQADGNVGVGTESPSEKLDVTGNVAVSGTVTATDFNTTSDASLKTNISTFENPLGVVSSLRGVAFDWIDGGKSEIGVIAQEVEKVLPNLVSTNKEGIKSVKYGNLIAVLIEAVKDQQSQINELKSKLS